MAKLKNFYNELHLNFTKEVCLIIISNLLVLALGISLFVIYKSINYIVLMIIIFVFLNAILIYRYILIKNKNKLNNFNEISDAFMYFYLEINNNIAPLLALTNMKTHCSIKMSEQISLLLDEIKKDKTFTPFIKFKNKYNSQIIESLLLSVYQLINNNSKESILVFNKSYQEFKNKVDETYKNTYKKQFKFITSTPVIGTMIITLIVIISTILLVRGYLNG